MAIEHLGRPPTFISHIQDMRTVEGCDITFTCILVGEPTPSIEWRRNDVKLEKDDTVNQHYDGRNSVLSIHDVSMGNSGSYSCVARNKEGEEKSSATLHVKKSTDSDTVGSSVLFLENLKDSNVFIGDSMKLKVRISGTHPIEVIWVHNDKQICDSGGSKYLDEGNGYFSLSLNDIQQKDSGLYVCEAYNNFGSSESLCSLNVSVRNWNRSKVNCQKLNDFNNNRKSSHKRCQSDDHKSQGIENHEIDFNKNLNEIQNGQSFDAKNGPHFEENVVFKPLKIIKELKNIEAEEGDSACLDCHFETPSHQETSVTWFKDRRELYNSSDIKICVDNGRTSLNIRDLSEKQHHGVYMCRITWKNDKVEKHITSSSSLVVLGEIIEPPVITKGPQSKTVMRGEKVVLRAQFNAKGGTVSWIKGGKEVKMDERIHISVYDCSTVLSLSNVESDDSGKYIVTVKNCSGTACHFASLAVEGPPEPPTEPPHVSNVTDSSLTLSWYGSAYDGGSIITGYTVEMCTPGKPMADNWGVLITGCHSTSYIVKNLHSHTEYLFRIRAQNVHGSSPPRSTSTPVRTLKEPIFHSEEDLCGSNVIVVEEDAQFDQLYDVKEELGRGRFGTVHRVINKNTGRENAAKFIKCVKTKDREKVNEEIEIMNELKHHKLLQLEGAYNSEKQIIMITEYIAGGELFERVVAEDFTLTEKDAILFMQQICDGVSYMHKNYIMHLDLKPENILCKSKTSHQIKIIDFGLARRYDPEVSTRVLFGTPEFIAPEIINYEPISPASDMWSLGVICYVLLSGLSPFMGDNDAETFANITRSDYDFDEEAFETVTKEAKDFIEVLLVKNIKKRFSAEQCLKHKWLAQHQRSMSSIALSTNKLKKFIIRRKWHKTGNAILALTRMTQMCGRSPLSNSNNHPHCTPNMMKNAKEIKMPDISEEETDSGHESISSVDESSFKDSGKLRKILLRKRFCESTSSSGDSIDIPSNISKI